MCYITYLIVIIYFSAKLIRFIFGNSERIIQKYNQMKVKLLLLFVFWGIIAVAQVKNESETTFPVEGSIGEGPWGTYLLGNHGSNRTLRLGVSNDGYTRAEIELENNNGASGKILFKTTNVNGGAVTRMFIANSGDLNLLTSDLSWGLHKIDLSAAPRTKISPMSLRLWDHYTYPTIPPGLFSYGSVIEIYGRSGHHTSQLFLGADGKIRHRSASYNSGWNNWKRLLDSKHDIESSGNFRVTGSGNHYFSNGKVGIGTTSPQSKLAVNGTITSKEVKVTVNNFPDYVFEPDYPLLKIEEVEAYITTNKHLPEIPSAKEVEENGIALGEMDAKLLQKIEELTLYTIEQEKKLKEQDEKLEAQEEFNQELLKELKLLKELIQK